MYEMLTGYPPFDGDSTVSIAVQHIQNEFPDIHADPSWRHRQLWKRLYLNVQ